MSGQKFETALEKSILIKDKIEEEDRYLLFAYYKQAIYGDNESGVPSWFDVSGRKKWIMWNDIRGITEEEAKEKYVELVDKFYKQFVEI